MSVRRTLAYCPLIPLIYPLMLEIARGFYVLFYHPRTQSSFLPRIVVVILLSIIHTFNTHIFTFCNSLAAYRKDDEG